MCSAQKCSGSVISKSTFVRSMATTAMRGIEDALPIAERFGDDLALAHARSTLGFALAHRDTDAERDRGQKLLAEVSVKLG
jgi:hypothetical protein